MEDGTRLSNGEERAAPFRHALTRRPRQQNGGANEASSSASYTRKPRNMTPSSAAAGANPTAAIGTIECNQQHYTPTEGAQTYTIRE